MVTGGSWSVFTSFAMLSQAGAAGRTALIDAGAAILGVDPADSEARDGMVIAGEQSIAYGDIVAESEIMRTFTDEELAAMPIKTPEQRNLIGRETMALDVAAKSRGEAVYGLDTELPDMVYAHPLIPPTRYGSVINSIDDSGAADIPGYIQTIAVPDASEFVQGWALVIAENFPAAMRAADAVEVDWTPGPTASVLEAHILEEGDRLTKDPSAGTLVADEGDVDAARENAAEIMSASYTTSTALHFTLEPQNALVEYVDGTFHIHAGNQWQSLIIPVLATALEVEETNIVLHQYYLGGGLAAGCSAIR